MANANVSRLGQTDGSGDVDEMFLKVFGGEVLEAFEETNVAMERSTVRHISSGKSAQFPATWKATAAYHTPGTEIVGQVILGNERVIVIDDLLISDVFIASIDEAKAHYDFRGPYSRALGAALARTMDRNILQVGVLAARASATVSGGNGGSIVTWDSENANTADAYIAALFVAAQKLDEKDVPETDRFAFLSPERYYDLVNSSSKLVNSDYTAGSNGGVDSGKVMRVAGLEIVKTNNSPTTDVTTGPTAYRGDFTGTDGLVMHKSAVGTVKLIDLAVEMAYDIRRQGTLIVGKYAVGHGILRPESAIEIVDDNT